MNDIMNDMMHELLNKLRIIGKIKKGQKLDTNNGLRVYNDSWLNWVVRKWNRDNKDEGIRYLRDLYKALGQSINIIINECEAHQDPKKNQRNIDMLINIAVEYKNSINGLDNLSKTYINFPETVASLDGILRDYVIVTYKIICQYLPVYQLPEYLLENIRYDGQIVFKNSHLIVDVQKNDNPYENQILDE
jgi:hypothetical protein